MLIFPSSLPTCVGQEDKELFQGYENWARRKEASSNPAQRKKRQSVFQVSHFKQDSPTLTRSPTAPRTASSGLPSSAPTPPATSPTTPASSHASPAPRNDPSNSYTDQKEEKEKEKEEKEEKRTQSIATPGPVHQLTPTDAQLQRKDLDPDYFIDATIKIPMKTISKIAIGCLALFCCGCFCCGCFGLFCQTYQKKKKLAATATNPPTFFAVNEEATKAPVTWEETLALRGLGGLGKLTTPSPPPVPRSPGRDHRLRWSELV